MTTSRSRRAKQPSFSGLSPATRKRLATHGITTLADLCDCTWLELHSLAGCGWKTTAECDELLKARGLIYRVKEPEDAFCIINKKLASEYADIGDYKQLGERYGLSAALMYEVYSALERSVKAFERTREAAIRWQAQVTEDEA